MNLLIVHVFERLLSLDINNNLIVIFCFGLLLPVGPRSVKINYLIMQGIAEYDNIDNYLANMIAAFYVGDNENKFLNVGRVLCRGRKKFIVELIEEQKHENAIKFFTMLQRLISHDSYAAVKVTDIVIANLNK